MSVPTGSPRPSRAARGGVGIPHRVDGRRALGRTEIAGEQRQEVAAPRV
jgi:hypothetical protein